MFKKIQSNPSLSLEEVFDEYIHSYDVIIRDSLDEPKKVSEARTKLKLIEKYNVDEVFRSDDNYEGYKISLNSFVSFYDQLSPEGKEKAREKFK